MIDLDLSKFFDTVNHSKLLQLLSDRIEDGRVISLIHRFLRAPISKEGKVSNKVTIGTPQGGVVSPVLANIMLNELYQLLDLIHRFLRAPISEEGKVSNKVTIGTPQGGVVSPVLANIMLNELYQLLDSRGIKFVRYADDMVIMCGSVRYADDMVIMCGRRKAAERILENVTKYVEKKLFLKVNKDKTKILHACEKSQFLGFGFTKRVSQRKKKDNF